MKKIASEPIVRALARERFNALPEAEQKHPSFVQFKDSLQQKGYGHYLDFRSRVGADCDAELWFDEELGQTWRR